MFNWRPQKLDRRVADEHYKVGQFCGLVRGQRDDAGPETAFGEQNLQETNARQRRRIAKDFSDFFDWPAVRQENALNLS